MAPLGFHPLRAWRALFAADAPPEAPTRELKAAYVAHVERLKAELPHEAAMDAAIGGGFESFGVKLAELLVHYGLQPDHYLIDVGCGAGRLAKPLAATHTGRYLGVDLSPDLLEHAQRICARPDWRFEEVDHIAIPEADEVADMVCFFSVLTHLRHEQSYWYLEEARRVLKPGGRVVFSFIEFRETGHMPIFWSTLAAEKAGAAAPMNVFLDREAIQRFADALGLELTEVRGGRDEVLPLWNLGHALAVLTKPG
jgi:2-polyprenyl-3-methyl-5-hydroxy-6-metoxy-1,4-benzoquinol methylase